MKTEGISFIQYRIIPACMAFFALVVSFPPVFRSVFYLNRNPGAFNQNGLYIIFIALSGSIGFTLIPGRFFRFLVIPHLLICGYYSATLDVYNFTIVFWGILTLWLAQDLGRSHRKIRMLMFIVSAMMFMFDCFLITNENRLAPDYKYVGDGPLYADHPEFGWHHLPDVRIRTTKTLLGETIYENIEYVTDSNSRRVCVQNAGEAPFHALFCGCSFTWGEGVPVESTVACRIQDASNGRLSSYNLAMQGGGTGHMYIKLAKPEYLQGINQKAGVCIYNYISDHGLRNTGHPLRTIMDATGYPLFRIDGAGKLDGPFLYHQDPYLGAYFKNRILLNHLIPEYRIRYKTRYKNIFSAETLAEVTAQLIRYSKYAYQTRYTGEFFVVFWPEKQLPFDAVLTTSRELLKNRLDELKIRYIEVPEVQNPADAVLHPIDMHPTVAVNDRVFQHIWPEIRDYVELLWLYHKPSQGEPAP